MDRCYGQLPDGDPNELQRKKACDRIPLDSQVCSTLHLLGDFTDSFRKDQLGGPAPA